MVTMMLNTVLVTTAAASLTIPGNSTNSTPNSIYDAMKYATSIGQVENGVLYQVNAPESASLKVVHVFGNATERGFAYGQLLADQMLHFLDVDLIEFYKSEVDQIPLNTLPPWLVSVIKGLLKDAAPQVFDLALGWVLDQQIDFIKAGKANVVQEGQAMIDGVCATLKNEPRCQNATSKAKLVQSLLQMNMLPELIRMQCSMMGAWGKATDNGHLTQLRTLDFGPGPFANNSILVVHHPDSTFSFASLSFPAFLGAVSGFSEHISFSQKVDDVTNSSRPKGTYKGQAVSMVIRDILQFSTSKEDSVHIAQKAKRTWSVWMGVGDYTSDQFLVMLYDEDAASPYNDQTLPLLTNQTGFTDVAYIDKHPQPSPHVLMPQLVNQSYGHINSTMMAQNFPRLMQSGDVHVLAYDFAAKKALISTGINNSTGGYIRLACDSPFLSFDMEKLWSEKRPSLNAARQE